MKRNDVKELYKLSKIAQTQLERGIITKPEYNRILIMIVEKLEIIQNDAEHRELVLVHLTKPIEEINLRLVLEVIPGLN